MKQLICEMCGSTDLIKQDGVFICQTCGTKYSVEEAKKMMVEGTVDVTGSTVKVDTSEELANLYQTARRARADNNGETAAKYYDMILVKDPTSWEAYFYTIYFKATECKVGEMKSAAVSITNSIDTVLMLIKEHVHDREQQVAAVKEVGEYCAVISNMIFDAAMKYWKKDKMEGMIESRWSSAVIMYTFGNYTEAIFEGGKDFAPFCIAAWNLAISQHNEILPYIDDKEANKNEILEYVEKIKKYDDSYVQPELNMYNGGCYIATAVYGSYDCPQVWTLRRYRDYTLAETWYGRAFIHTYYAISPTLVKWFGHTEWFKKMWKGKLDRMVANLKADGVEDTPYEDRKW